MEMEPAVSQFVAHISSRSVNTPCCWNFAFYRQISFKYEIHLRKQVFQMLHLELAQC